jgi:hypothetical protein
MPAMVEGGFALLGPGGLIRLKERGFSLYCGRE